MIQKDKHLKWMLQLVKKDFDKLVGAVKEPNVHSQPHYNFISSKPMKEKNA